MSGLGKEMDFAWQAVEETRVASRYLDVQGICVQAMAVLSNS